ncbi:MAG: hypothetical protein U5Q03_10090 [Bacteroidota bacterium]|nr:hypothetical protein [Bacteroidota bacterium]
MKTRIQLLPYLSFLLLILGIFLCVYTYSQNSFEILHSTPRNEGIIQIIETENNDYLAAGYEGEFFQPENLKGLILKISNTGDTSIFRYNLGDTSLFFIQIVPKENNHYMVFGSAYIPEQNSQQLFISEFDSNLAMISYKLYRINGYVGIYEHHIQKSNFGYYLACIVNNIENKNHLMLAKIQSNGDTLSTRIYSDLGGACTVSALEYSSDSSGLWVLGRGYGSMYGERIVFDSNLNFKYKHFLPNQALNYYDVKWISDTSLILASIYNHDGSPQDDDMGISEVDTSFTQKDIIYIGSEDTIDYPAAYSSFDFTNPDTLFYAGTNHIIPVFFPNAKNHLMIGSLSRSLEPITELLIGGDAYYYATNIICTSDGGYLISSKRYDYEVQDNEWDVMFLKLSKQDLITASLGQLVNATNSIVIYPNPGKDRIFIKSSMNEGKFLLYNSIGKLCMNIKICRGQNLIQTQKLCNGIYSYVILKKSRVIDSGKWIKASSN